MALPFIEYEKWKFYDKLVIAREKIKIFNVLHHVVVKEKIS
jgi:hypothetical protein